MSHAARSAARPATRPAAWWGMLVLIASEGALFAAMLASYFYLSVYGGSWPLRGDPQPPLVTPIVLTGMLALTSIPMQLASLAARDRRLAPTRIFLLVALAVQAVYLAWQLHDFSQQLDAMNATHDAYSSIYYTLLGADHAHVALGILLDIWLLAKLTRGLTSYRRNAALAITWYWHFVNLVTVIVTATLLTGRA
jgi:heme/copper-type cytochrome/quinol oxidase subunit 3